MVLEKINESCKRKSVLVFHYVNAHGHLEEGGDYCGTRPERRIERIIRARSTWLLKNDEPRIVPRSPMPVCRVRNLIVL